MDKESKVEIIGSEIGSRVDIPMVENGIKAGFPSPAEDFIQSSIDLNDLLIDHPSSTFFGRVSGDSMQDLGISDGDLIIIDKSLPVRDGKVAICFIDGEFTMKSIKIEKDCCWFIFNIHDLKFSPKLT